MEKTYFALISERKLDDSFLHPNLTILSGKNCVLLNSVKNGCLAASELFICLHDQSRPIHSIITH